MGKHVVVVGAGLGGLATALRLAHRGLGVTVLEKTSAIGGRCRKIRVGECTFDAGATLLMMLDPFEKLFEDVGERLSDHLQVTRLDPSYRVFWRDGSQIDASPDRERMADSLRDLAGESAVAAYRRLLVDLEGLYEEAIPKFVRRNFDSPLDLARPASLAAVIRHGMLGNLAKNIERRFSDPRLRMLFSFQSMYLGLSPFDAPWVYSLLTYMECGQGIYYSQGGLGAISEAVASLAKAKGVGIRLESPVSRVSQGRVELESGEALLADAVVINADLPYAQRELLGRRIPKWRRSCSALMLYAQTQKLEGLSHHNVFFGKDFRGNLDSIFREPLRPPEDPAFYACVSARSDPRAAPEGKDNLMLLIPCPNLDRPLAPNERERLLRGALERVACVAGVDEIQLEHVAHTTPEDWQGHLNLEGGAAFGLSHDFFQSACFRPSNRDPKVRNLYYVGASTAPGNGLPMVLIGAELVEQRLEADGVLSP